VKIKGGLSKMPTLIVVGAVKAVSMCKLNIKNSKICTKILAGWDWG